MSDSRVQAQLRPRNNRTWNVHFRPSIRHIMLELGVSRGWSPSIYESLLRVSTRHNWSPVWFFLPQFVCFAKDHCAKDPVEKHEKSMDQLPFARWASPPLSSNFRANLLGEDRRRVGRGCGLNLVCVCVNPSVSEVMKLIHLWSLTHLPAFRELRVYIHPRATVCHLRTP